MPQPPRAVRVAGPFGERGIERGRQCERGTLGDGSTAVNRPSSRCTSRPAASATAGDEVEARGAAQRRDERLHQAHRTSEELGRRRRWAGTGFVDRFAGQQIVRREPRSPGAASRLRGGPRARSAARDERVPPRAGSDWPGRSRADRARRSTRGSAGRRCRSSRATRAARAPRCGRARRVARRLAPEPPATLVDGDLPTRSRCSGSVSRQAAASPAIPPPSTATSGRRDVIVAVGRSAAAPCTHRGHRPVPASRRWRTRGCYAPVVPPTPTSRIVFGRDRPAPATGIGALPDDAASRRGEQHASVRVPLETRGRPKPCRPRRRIAADLLGAQPADPSRAGPAQIVAGRRRSRSGPRRGTARRQRSGEALECRGQAVEGVRSLGVGTATRIPPARRCHRGSPRARPRAPAELRHVLTVLDARPHRRPARPRTAPSSAETWAML